MEFFLSPALAVFSGVLAALAVICVLELVAAVIGTGLGHLLHVVTDTHSIPDTALTEWLLIKDVPMMVTLTAMLGGFGLTGMCVQLGANALFGFPLILPLAIVIAVAGALAAMRCQALLFKKLKVVHTTALDASEFFGQHVTVLSPIVTKALMGEAKFTDRHGQTHYLMVRPVGDEPFKKGQLVELLEPTNGGYLGRPLP